MSEKKNLVIITGPTASGKSEIAVRLAEKINGSIISADSMQVYKGMDIGTAKITKEEMRGVPHFLIDILEPDEPFNISRFKDMANEALDIIYGQGRIPVIAGGTAFYIQALLKQVDFEKESGENIKLRENLEKEDTKELFEKLKEADPKSCEIIHPNNKKRIIRALEYFYLTGQPISEHNKKQAQKEPPFNFAYFVLKRDRQKLYEKINARVDKMWENGLIEEVKKLKDSGYVSGLTSMQAIGYKEVYEFLEGKISEEKAKEAVKQNTRHFAKRQLTWFRRENDVIWLDIPDTDDYQAILLKKMSDELRNRGIIQ